MEEQSMLMCSLCCLSPCESAAHTMHNDNENINNH